MAHVAYVPSEKVVGLSKLARVVEAYSRRLQTQERLTMQIANSIYKGLKSHGSAVSIEAEHQCMTTRGVRKDKAITITNYFTGVFRDSLNLQQRFLTYIKD
jgi:GTP cyclohydrolase I